MGIIWDIIRGGKSVVNKAKWIFTQKPTTVTPQKTLNEEINSQSPTTQVGSFPNISDNQFDIGEIQSSAIQGQPYQDAATLSVPTIETQRRANVRARNNVGNKLSIAEQIEEEAEDSIFDKISNVYSRYRANERYNKEVEENSKTFNLSYNPAINRITILTPKDEWAFDARLGHYLSELDTATTSEEKQRARQSFYDDVKDSFKAQQIVNPKKFTWWKTYSDETLAPISGKDVKPWNYPISEEEFNDYLGMLWDNYDIQRDTYKKYENDLTAWLDRVDLEEAETTNEIKQRWSDIAKKDTLELINRNLASTERWEAIRNVDEIVNDPIDRLLTSDMYLKRLRDEAAQTPELQRTEWQRNMIYNYDVIWKQLMDQYASNVNDYLMLQLTEWVNDKWEISDALWRFEDGSKLNDILRNNLGEIAGIDVKWSLFWWWWAGETFWKVSAIDIMKRFANEAAYEYEQGKYTQWDNPFKYAWNQYEHFKEPVWEQFAEAWQTVWKLGTKIVNTVSSAFQRRRWWNSPAAAYWDADFSVGKLIETDDSPNKRTVKKYGLQFWEYIPEWLAVAAPDAVLTFASAGGTASSVLRSFGTAANFFKRFNRVKKLLEETSKTAKIVGGSLKGLEKVWEMWKYLWNINSREKRVLNIADRTLSQFAIWQSMDAKLSAFDTEPYSDTSFWLSMWGSLLWDILPEAKDIWWIMRTWIKGWKAWTKWTWVWDLVDFISQSDENALAIARQMWKHTANFSEQDLKNYVRAYANITDAAKRVYNELPDTAKAAANEWTKELMYNYVRQAYQWDTRIWKAVRAIVQNKATNPADIIKYIWWIPWTVSVWPYQSTIRLKQWTLAWVQTKNRGWYDIALDSIDWWFGHKVSRWFTFKDLQDMSRIDWYEDILKNRDKYFRKVTEKIKKWGKDSTQTRWILSEDWLDRFWLEAKNLTLASLWIEISWAEDVKAIFKEKMKELEGMKLSEDTIDALAENWGYNEVVSKIENILC